MELKSMQQRKVGAMKIQQLEKECYVVQTSEESSDLSVMNLQRSKSVFKLHKNLHSGFQMSRQHL